MQVDGQERKEELMEPQNEKLLSESKSADVWYQLSGTHLYELGWQLDRFLITKIGFLELLGHWKRIFGQQYYQQKARRVRPAGDIG